MSTPFLYIGLPIVLAVSLFFIRKRERLSIIIGMSLFAGLCLLAYFHEFGEILKIGPLSVELRTTLSILGREFTLANPDRFFLIVTCLTSLTWLGGVKPSGLNVNVVSYQLLVVASLTAALAVDPFIYSAIFVEIAMLCAMPLLIHAGEPLGKGVLRFLIYQSISMPLILIGGWMLLGSQASPSDTQQLGIAGFFLATGFALWLAVFPFHSWVPQLSEDVPPYISGFLLTFFPQVALLVFVDFTSSITWIRESAIFGSILLVIGSLMLVITALWALHEKNVKRLLGFLVLFETGALLLLLGMQTELTIQTFYLAQIPRFLSIIAASLCVSIIFGDDSSTPEMAGSFWRYPVASIGLLVSLFSIIGLPPFGEFPYKLIMINAIGTAQKTNPIWLILGFVGILLPVFGLMKRMFSSDETRVHVNEKLSQILLICIGIFLLLLVGLYPGGLQLLFTRILHYLPMSG